MGHERVGVLPRSQQWRAIVHELASAAESEAATRHVAAATLDNVKHRFAVVHRDRGVQAALGYLIGLTSAHLPGTSTDLVPTIALGDNPSALALSQRLAGWVQEHAESAEYAALATRAAADAIASWTRRNSRQAQLFATETPTTDLWRRAATGAAFSELSRTFFAKFTERYLNYFLEREASAAIPSLRDRDVFATRLGHHLDAVAKHAFETTRIAQSFAAGWYNKNARNERPSGEEVRGFLSFAFGKLRAELERERAG
jgi:hypothetical protein